jgi:hypothetical protein
MRQSTDSYSLKYRLVQQGIAALEQGNWQTALDQFMQILQYHAGSIQVFVNPRALINLNCWRITITIAIDQQVDKTTDQPETNYRVSPTIHVQDNLTNYRPESPQQNSALAQQEISITPTEPEVLDILEQN